MFEIDGVIYFNHYSFIKKTTQVCMNLNRANTMILFRVLLRCLRHKVNIN